MKQPSTFTKPTAFFLLLAGLLLTIVTPMVQAEEPPVQERLIYSTTFQEWDAVSSSTTPVVVNKTTSFSNEAFTMTFGETLVDPAGVQLTRFKYLDGSGKGVGPFTIGYAMAAKSPTAFIETSVFKHLSRVKFVHGATGSNRGWKLLKKSATDANWVVLSSAVANPADGAIVECTINESNVAIRFENITSDQNAYMAELNLYGMVAITSEQVSLTTGVTPEGAASVAVTPLSSSYNKGSVVHLKATRNFGYRFIGWMNGDSLVSDQPEFDYTLNQTDTLTAHYETIDTYAFDCKVEGSRFGRYTLSPAPTNGRYETGTTVMITPHSNEVMTFLSWEDGTTSKQRVITITADTTLTATWSEIDYIVGWDFFNSGNNNLTGQFYAETTNSGLFSAVKLADASTTSWLEKSGATTSEGKNCAINWKSNDQLGQYGFQTTFGTHNVSNIRVKYEMMSSGYSTHSRQILQYSVDSAATFVNLDTLTLETPKSWVGADVLLPDTCAGLNKLYLRWVADLTSPVIGSTGNDGTAITNIFVLADREHVADTIAPVLLATLPADAGTGASASGSIILTFNEKVLQGTGDITLGEDVLTGRFGSSNAIFAYAGLTYGQAYTVTVPAGAIVDQSGNAFAGITFTFTVMNKVQPAAKLFDAIVSKDSTTWAGTLGYATIKEAIDAAPANSGTPYLIYIKAGRYNEHLQIDKRNIHLIGEGADKVIITDNRLSGSTTDPSVPAEKQNLHVSQSATVVVNGSDFFAEGISFENDWGVSKLAGPQALALYTVGDKVILHKCKLRSYQDTYLTTYSQPDYRHYLKDCFIEGAVDFIYGGGDVFFDACTIYINRDAGGYITAPSHAAETKWGYIFMNNTIDAPKSTLVYFGRPWQNKPKVSFVNTKLGKNVSIYGAGWYETMGAIPAIFADYNTMDWEGNPVDLSNRNDYYYYTDKNTNTKVEGNAKSSLTDEEVRQYTVKNVLGGDDNWMPGEALEPCVKPTATLTATALNWDAVPYAIGYVVTVNDTVMYNTTETSLPLSTIGLGKVSIQAVNEHGSLSEATTLQVTVDKQQLAATSLVVLGQTTGIVFKGVTVPTAVEVFQLDGRLAYRQTLTKDGSLTVKRGLYVVRMRTSGGVRSVKVMVGLP
ncbi:MAG: pectinesterase [Bacteroidales bacterium]|nr:pectinesterase [Bacteroidales bacterium]